MKTPGEIALKNAGVGIVALMAGAAIWGLIQDTWPNFMGLGAVGAVLAMSVTWAAREAYAAGLQAGASAKTNSSPDQTTFAEQSYVPSDLNKK